MRRMVKGMELYRTSAVIDLINLLSVACGHSIGGFDADRIDGDTVTLELDGKPITMKIENDNAMSADPTQFGIDGFDSIEFALY